MTSIDPIVRSLPTYYNGTVFRSRLEARWAIIFDEMGIAWEYEAEAISVLRYFGTGIHLDEYFGYLPDFYLPEVDAFVEVKGQLDREGFLKLLSCAHTITTPACGTPGSHGGKPFFVAGNLSHGKVFPSLTSIFNYKGDLWMNDLILEFEQAFDSVVHVCTDGDEWSDDQKMILKYHSQKLCNNYKHLDKDFESFPEVKKWRKAFEKGRSARFQDGRHV